MNASTQWQLAREAAERYEQILVPTILGPAAKALVDYAGLVNGETVLDIGCGTGAAARLAAERVGPSGRVIGIDVNAGMIEVAKSLPVPPGVTIEWLEKSAYELPVEDGTIDVALSAQTLQFLKNRSLGLSEKRRVLKAGGRVAISLWCPIEENPYFYALVGAVSRHVGEGTAVGLAAIFGLSNIDEIHSLLQDAGFESIQTKVIKLDLDLPNLTEFVPRHIGATPMAAGYQAASLAAQDAVVREVAERFVRDKARGGVRVPFRTYVIRAKKGF